VSENTFEVQKTSKPKMHDYRPAVTRGLQCEVAESTGWIQQAITRYKQVGMGLGRHVFAILSGYRIPGLLQVYDL
jgi:hypothetical protein